MVLHRYRLIFSRWLAIYAKELVSLAPFPWNGDQGFGFNGQRSWGKPLLSQNSTRPHLTPWLSWWETQKRSSSLSQADISLACHAISDLKFRERFSQTLIKISECFGSPIHPFHFVLAFFLTYSVRAFSTLSSSAEGCDCSFDHVICQRDSSQYNCGIWSDSVPVKTRYV